MTGNWNRPFLSIVVPAHNEELRLPRCLTLIEAFRQGTPVLARRIGPFPEIVAQSGGGELFDRGDDLLVAMRRLQNDESHRRRLAAAGTDAVRKLWSESVVVPQYLNIVSRTAERKGLSLREKIAS